MHTHTHFLFLSLSDQSYFFPRTITQAENQLPPPSSKIFSSYFFSLLLSCNISVPLRRFFSFLFFTSLFFPSSIIFIRIAPLFINNSLSVKLKQQQQVSQMILSPVDVSVSPPHPLPFPPFRSRGEGGTTQVILYDNNHTYTTKNIIRNLNRCVFISL